MLCGAMPHMWRARAWGKCDMTTAKETSKNGAPQSDLGPRKLQVSDDPTRTRKLHATGVKRKHGPEGT